MANIYSGIEGIDPPKFSFDNFTEYQKQGDEYVNKLKAEAVKNSNDEIVGETIRFQVADGYAVYMVCSVKPLELIHINLVDGYQSEFAELLTVKKVREMVAREKKLAELFSK